MEHLVKLMEDDSPEHYVMARDCEIHRTSKDTITWKNSTRNPYTIHFTNSPFQGNDFVVPPQGEVKSPALKADVEPGSYAYFIQPPAAEMAADPNVIVR